MQVVSLGHNRSLQCESRMSRMWGNMFIYVRIKSNHCKLHLIMDILIATREGFLRKNIVGFHFFKTVLHTNILNIYFFH